MARLELEGVSHAYVEGDYAVRDIDLTWEEGVASALLGPSGSGKTTVLKIISGLLRPSEGRVLLDGVDVTNRSPQERNIAQVFQFPVVYETLTVFDNLAFPLRNQGQRGSAVRKRVLEVAEILGLEDVLRRNANRLGAAEQQRVSLGRGIVRSDISAVLLDEPLTVIDPQEKWRLRRQLRALHGRIGMTMIYVTHDQQEALTFADQVTVMDVGRAVQTGSPQDLHERPADPFVGYFIGSPGMNLFDARLGEDGLRVGGMRLPLDQAGRERLTPNRDALQVGVRPEFVDARLQRFDGAHQGEITAVDMTGHALIAHVSGAELTFKAKLPEDAAARAGDAVWFAFPPARVNVYADRQRVEGLP